jgi:hypothetical protein
MMPKFQTSGPMRPYYESAPYRQHPTRRQHIHGPLRPMNEPRKAESIFYLYGAIFALIALYLFARP